MSKEHLLNSLGWTQTSSWVSYSLNLIGIFESRLFFGGGGAKRSSSVEFSYKLQLESSDESSDE